MSECETCFVSGHLFDCPVRISELEARVKDLERELYELRRDARRDQDEMAWCHSIEIHTRVKEWGAEQIELIERMKRYRSERGHYREESSRLQKLVDMNQKVVDAARLFQLKYPLGGPDLRPIFDALRELDRERKCTCEDGSGVSCPACLVKGYT